MSKPQTDSPMSAPVPRLKSATAQARDVPDQGGLHAEEPSRTREEMRTLYNAYFASHDYDQRYPRPNLGTMRFLRRHGAMQFDRALDFGCGSGRYAVPLLEESGGRLTGYDISEGAIAAFAQRIKASPLAARLELIHGGVEQIPADPRFDVILMLFGVLSHVGSRNERLALLRRLREMATADCRFFVTVPSIWRRRPLELLGSIPRHDREVLGDIRFSRMIAGQQRSFHYHLYSVTGLRAELAEAGWKIEVHEAESILPEYLVTRSGLVGRVDRLLQRLVPTSLGYGIRVLARPVEGGG